jgi:transcriptional regulator with XRE-family HTH domain
MDNITGKRLEELREEHGWTKSLVAKKLGIRTMSTYANWEYGIRKPDGEMLSKIADLYDVTTDYLHGRTNTRKSSSESNSQELTEKDEKDIAKRMEDIRKDLTSEDGLMFDGEPMSEEAVESFLEAMEYAVRQTQRINKKYIPKKYRDKEND